MADNNPAKLDQDDRIPNDDPMLELTRIMGVGPAAEAEPDLEEFGIDLEREMLGEAGAGDRDVEAVSLDAQSNPDDLGLDQPAVDAVQLSEDDLELPDFSLDGEELDASDNLVPDLEQQLLDELVSTSNQRGDAGVEADDRKSDQFPLEDDLAAVEPDADDAPELRESLAAALGDLPPIGAVGGDDAGVDPVLDQMFHDDDAAGTPAHVEADAVERYDAPEVSEVDLDHAPIAEQLDDGFDWPDAQDLPDADTQNHAVASEVVDSSAQPNWPDDGQSASNVLDKELAGLLADINDSVDREEAGYSGSAEFVANPTEQNEDEPSFARSGDERAPDDHSDASEQLSDGLVLDSTLLDDELLADLDDAVLEDDMLDIERPAEQYAAGAVELGEPETTEDVLTHTEDYLPASADWGEQSPVGHEAEIAHTEAYEPEAPGDPLRSDFESDDQSGRLYDAGAAVAAAAGGVLSSSAPWRDEPSAEYATHGGARHEADDAPDFETHEILERAAVVDDDLGIPEFDDNAAFGAAPSSDILDDLPPELPAGDTGPELTSQQPPLQDDFESFFFEELENPDEQPVERADRWANDDASEASQGIDTLPGGYAQATDEISPEAFGAATAGAAYAADQVNSENADSRKRGMLIAAVVAGVVVIGGVGAFALSSGGNLSSTSEPAIVRADADPVKVKPENPGGTTVPNQDKEVYQRVAGQSADQEPAQQSLVTTAETPVDVASKSEERVSPSQVSDEPGVDGTIAAVTPRRVRTMIVRADGTLVPREEIPAETSTTSPAPATAAPEQMTPAADAQAASQPAATVLPAEPVAGEPAPGEAEETVDLEFPPTAPVPTPRADGIAAVAQDSARAAPQRIASTGPLVESRPAEQPVTIVGQTGAQTTAAQAPASAATSTPAAWVQISSQPSRELAQSSYANLSQRYASIIGGRGVNIVPAEIAGRGTFYRVNVPADDLRQASEMCGRIKAAGGDCLPRRQRAQ